MDQYFYNYQLLVMHGGYIYVELLGANKLIKTKNLNLLTIIF